MRKKQLRSGVTERGWRRAQVKRLWRVCGAGRLKGESRGSETKRRIKGCERTEQERD